jgi:hypothetical protein
MKRIGALAIALPLLLGLAGLAAAQGARESAQASAQGFYRGKQLKLIVGTSSGQDYDLWARLIGRHITRHIPGQALADRREHAGRRPHRRDQPSVQPRAA